MDNDTKKSMSQMKTECMEIKTPIARVKRLFFDSASGSMYHSIADVPRRLEINPETIDMFIRLGYVSGDETLFKGIQCLPGGATIQISDGKWKVIEQFRYGDLVNKDIYRDVPEEELIKQGKQKWLQVIDNLYNNQAETVVPISGGLDSRAILAGLLECADAASIQTYTFGLPNTYDYDIGNRVATQAGTKHTRFDLSRFTFDDEILAATCRQTDGNVNLFWPGFTLPIVESYGEGAEFWSGFMLDVLAGHFVTKSNMIPQRNTDLNKEIRECFLHGAKKISCHSVAHSQIDKWIRMIDIDSRCSKEIALDEQLHSYLGVERDGGSQILFKDYDYVTPFAENQWMEFMLSVPISLRLGKRLYKRLFRRSFPSLFSLPIKDNAGVSLDASKLVVTLKKIKNHLRKRLDRRYLNPKTNYIDFNRELRSHSPFKQQVEASVANLKKRELIDSEFVDSLWREHHAGKQNNAKILLNLASLENIIRTFDLRC